MSSIHVGVLLGLRIVFLLADVLLSFGRDYQCTQSTSFLGPGMSVGNGGGGISGVGVFEDQVSCSNASSVARDILKAPACSLYSIYYDYGVPD